MGLLTEKRPGLYERRRDLHDAEQNAERALGLVEGIKRSPIPYYNF